MTGQAPSAVEEVLRYAFRQGPGRDYVAPLGPPNRPLTTSFGTLPDRVATDRMCHLPWGTVDLLEDTLYPFPSVWGDVAAEDRIQHALVMAFGLQHREPSNLFNDHRSCASVRSKFPVHAFVHTGVRAWLLDVYRHAVLPVGDACPVFPTGEPVSVALAGRYTHLPSPYGLLRGPLTELELGISLRSLWVALEVFGLTGSLRLPGHGARRLMDQLGLDQAGQWSVPLSVAIDAPASPPVTAAASVGTALAGAGAACPDRGAADAGDGDGDGDGDDPTLDEVVAVNRMSLDAAVPGPSDTTVGGAQAIPGGVSAGGRSWSEVLWQRTAGRMPRALAGFSGRRQTVAAAAVTDAVAWVALPPPTPILERIAARITVTACLQDTTGFETGQYRLERGDDSPPRLQLVRADPKLPRRLEACYGHATAVDVGCAVHQANMVWLLAADVGGLIETFGAGGWTLAQYACGWMVHGLCLSAAAHGLYARPNRAFDEILLQPVVGLAPGELVLLSVVSGVGRFVEPLLDLRS